MPQDNEVAIQLGAPLSCVYPTLAAYFLAYDQYRFNGGMIEYVPLCPATTTGSSTVCVVDDPLAVVDVTQLSARPDAVSFPVWHAGLAKIRPTRWLETGFGSDLRDTSAFTIYFFSSAYGEGQWWFHYNFDFAERRAVPKPRWDITNYTANAYYRVTYIDTVGAGACVSLEANAPAISDGKYFSLRSSTGVPVTTVTKGTVIQAFIDGIHGLEPSYDGIPFTVGQVIYVRIAERLATLAGANTQVTGTTSYIEQVSLDAAGTKKISFTGADATYISLQGILSLAG
jgi:predicted RecA/RadA family phage recombinase